MTPQTVSATSSVNGNKRMLIVLGLLVVGMVGLAYASVPLYDLFCRVTGYGGTTQIAENVNEDICQIGYGAFAVELDLMEPLDSELRPRVDTPPLNHIGLWVDDLQTAYEWLINQGVRMAPGGIRKGASGHDVCFIHPKGNDEFPKSALGVLVELVQAPDSVMDAHSSLPKG